MAFKDIFNKKEINLYCCGPTVYDLLHIGNARPVIVTDFLVRYLEYKNIKVNYLINITDIDDKIIEKALEEKVLANEVSKKYKEYFLNNLKDLKIRKPNSIISISDKIEEIKIFIDILIKNKAAYYINQNVYFDLDKFKNEYGKVSGQIIDNNLNSVRIVNENDKKNHFDFSLWKNTNKGISFEFKNGFGRPGWHTECAVLIDEYFKSKQIDLHIGGIDLKFPHHENESIQYFAKNGVSISKEWYHVGHVMLNDQKMSKSIGNIITINSFILENSSNSLKFLFANSNHTQPLNIGDDIIKFSNNWIDKVFNLLKKINWMKSISLISEIKLGKTFKDQFISYMDDDLNTPMVITLIDEIIKSINSSLQKNELDFNLFEEFKKYIDVLGFDFEVKNITDSDKNDLLQWNGLIKNKEFEKADLLRKKLIERGIL